MGYDLSGKVVAITGASSGIGAATALLCAQSGAAVALGARRADRIEALAEQIEAQGGVATAITSTSRPRIRRAGSSRRRSIASAGSTR